MDQLTGLMAHTPFAETATLLVLAAAAGFVGLQLRQPLLVGYIAVGVLAGPAALDVLRSTEQLTLLSELGVAVLLFLVGIRLDLQLVRSLGAVALTAGLGQVAATATAGFALALALGFGWAEAAYLGVALTFSSTIIVVKLLSDRREIDALHGQIALGVLIVQDLVVIAVMLALSATGAEATGAGGPLQVLGIAAAMLAAVAAFVRWLAGPLTERLARSPELLTLFALGLAAAMAAAAEAAGLGQEIGGLLAGVALASTPFREAIASRLGPLRDFLLLFFFVGLGAHLDLDRLGADLPAAAALSLFVLAVKPLVVIALLGRLGYRRRTGFLAGITLGQISEFSLILVAFGAGLGHVAPATMGLVTLVGVVTIAASSYVIDRGQALFEVFAPLLGPFERPGARREGPGAPGPRRRFDAVVFGQGRFGGAVARRLAAADWRVLCVDFNPAALKAARRAGMATAYGDAGDPAFVAELPLEGVRWVVAAIPAHARGVTHDDPRLTLLRALEEADFRGGRLALAHGAGDRAALEAAGATLVVEPFEDGADRAVERLTAAEGEEPAAATS